MRDENASGPTPDSGGDRSIAMIAHEMRGPLTVVRGYLEILSRPGLAEEQRAEAAGAGLRALNRLQRLISELPASGNDAPGATLVPEPLDLADLARDVATELTPVFDGRFDVTGDAAPVFGDARRLRQAVANLVVNALEHGGSTVRIDTGVEDETAFLGVEDDGPGVPAEDRARLMKVGERGVGHQPGRGLGLAISEGIAAAHGGSLGFEDPRTLHGARIVLRLPVERRARG